MNEWLTPVVDAYTQKYGTVDTPNVWEVGSRDGIDGYEIAERIAQNPNKVLVTCIEPNPEQMAILKESYPLCRIGWKVSISCPPYCPCCLIQLIIRISYNNNVKIVALTP